MVENSEINNKCFLPEGDAYSLIYMDEGEGGYLGNKDTIVYFANLLDTYYYRTGETKSGGLFILLRRLGGEVQLQWMQQAALLIDASIIISCIAPLQSSKLSPHNTVCVLSMPFMDVSERTSC